MEYRRIIYCRNSNYARFGISNDRHDPPISRMLCLGCPAHGRICNPDFIGNRIIGNINLNSHPPDPSLDITKANCGDLSELF